MGFSSDCDVLDDFEALDTTCLGPTGTSDPEVGLGLELGGIVVAQAQEETETIVITINHFFLTKKATAELELDHHITRPGAYNLQYSQLKSMVELLVLAIASRLFLESSIYRSSLL